MIAFILALVAAAPAAGPPVPPAAAVAEPAIDVAGLWLEPGKTYTVTLTPAGVVEVPPDRLVENRMQFTGEAVRFSFDRMKDMLVLEVNNGYGRMLRYKAEIYLADGRNAHTSTCPVIAHISGAESWQEPIARLHITNLELLPANAERVCD